MSSSIVRQLLEQRLSSEWSDRTIVIWDDSNYVPRTGVSFIRVTLDEIDSEPMSMSCDRDYYLLVIQVLTAKGAGASDNLTLCDELKRIYNRYVSGTLKCTKGVTERVGNYKEWYQRNVVVDLHFDNNFDPSTTCVGTGFGSRSFGS